MHLYKKMIYLLILLLVVTSCSSTDRLEPIKSQEQSMLNEKNKEISLGKYESPNGNDYQLFQIGTGFYYIDNENKHSNIFSNTGTLIKFINDNNPLVIDTYITKNNKQYKITEYKKQYGFIKENGDKGKNTFNTKNEVYNYLDKNNQICHYKIISFISSKSGNENSDRKKYLDQNHILEFSTLNDCGGKTKTIKADNGFFSEIIGKYGEYHGLDTYSFVGGFGVDDILIKTEKNDKGTITLSNRSNMGGDKFYVNTIDFTNDGFSISLNDDVLEKAQSSFEELKFILQSSKIYGEKVKFDLNNLSNYYIDGSNFEYNNNTYGLVITDKNGISKSFSIKNIDILPEDFLSGCGSNSAGISCFIDKYNEKQQTFNINYESISGGVSKIFSFNINTGILKLTSSKENEPYDRSNELNNNYLPENFGDL